MRKIFYIVFLFFVYISSTFASDDIKIISRAEWWADESIRYVDSPEWQAIFKKRQDDAENTKNIVYTQEQLDAQNIAKEKSREKNKLMTDILNSYSFQREVSSKITTENGRKLYWPIEKSKKILWIVIHHTSTEYATSLEWIRSIYRYHTLTNGWWDIWYNYVIWKDWEIFEWRAWWDDSVGAHTKYNNISNIWISVLGNYQDKPINDKQYQSLKSLTAYLIKKYDIDLNKKMYYHSECIWKGCDLPLITELKDPIIWHRDAWHTDCPWEELYKQIQSIKSELTNNNLSVTKVNKNSKYKTLEKFSDDKLIGILANIENQLDIKKDSNKLKLKRLIVDYFKYKSAKNTSTTTKTNQKISIKLSYPNNDSIKIKSWNTILEITREWNSVYLNWNKFNELKIPKKDANSILEIVSWDRVPEWDKEKKYNDNKFRWDLIVYAKDDKLIVLNRLNMEDYLKWLWEVSDSEDSEKIKTIVIAARSYATWYITKDKKFPWELYDWVDDPNVFQKYLWYGLETRSTNINKIVDETRWKVITYKWELIKPWYFSNSDGKTMSYYDYCREKYTDDICKKEAKNYPYLTSVPDKWSDWKVTKWHWVWISWAWVKYFAEKWWSYNMIIKYFLKGVDV